MSKFLSIDQQDVLKGALLAIFFAVIQGTYSITSTGVLPTMAQWQGIIANCMNVFYAYVVKNFFTNSSNGLPFKSEPKNELPSDAGKQ